MQEISSDNEQHEAAQALLSWYIGGRLEFDDRVLVETHLEDCASCRRDLAAEGIIAEALDTPAPTADASWARMQVRLDEAQRGTPATLPIPAPRRSRNRRWIFSGPASGRRLGWVVAAQSAAIVLLVGWMTTAPALRQGSPDGAYRALSAGPADPGGNVLAMFRPTTTEGELRQLLGFTGARVVNGPTSAGAYVLAVPGGPDGTALATLRRSPWVTMAEPIGDKGTP